ncbi:PspA/IM30 family protein [Roseibium salinum]|uniref:PspA/IM30 family protein n=1 Tax=Roseibium salinum TaxID=1604349 RepID=UPI0029E72328|nr:PspA/IM30 family protein [Roseibium salinum]
MFEPFITQLKALFLDGAAGHHDRQSLAGLSANLRSAAVSVRAAQEALARARAEQQQDRRRLSQICTSIEDLENRARNALLKGLEPLAREAAEAIALLEDEKTDLEAAIQSFDQDLARLTDTLHRAQSRLRALKRGERTADVRDRIQKAQSLGAGAGQSALTRAEDQLEEILHRQERDQLADVEFDALSISGRPQALIEKLGDAGCGEPVRNSADDVLARLKSEIPLLLEKKSN